MCIFGFILQVLFKFACIQEKIRSSGRVKRKEKKNYSVQLPTTDFFCWLCKRLSSGSYRI